MRILLLAPYPPYPPRSGGALRIFHLLHGLAQQHEVTCLAFAPDDAAVAVLQPLREQCHLVTVLGPPQRSLTQRAWTTLASPLPDMALRNAATAYRTALRDLLQQRQFDVIQAESIEMGGYGLAAGRWLRQRGERVPLLVLDEFNAEYLLQRRAALNDVRRGVAARSASAQSLRALVGGGYSLVQWHKLARFERRLLHAYDRVLVVSDNDRRALQRLMPDAPLCVVPNGVDTAHFAPSAAAASGDRPTVVFTGTLDYRPNVDAVRWFVHEVLPHIQAQQPQVQLLLVGRSPAPAVQQLHNDDNIVVVGEVADVRPFIRQASAYVVPMRIGGGVRLKLLEALAMEAAVVSTAMGAEGVVGVDDGEHLLLADEPRPFAAAVVRLLGDGDLRRRLGRAGRTAIAARYDWHAIVPLLERCYRFSGA